MATLSASPNPAQAGSVITVTVTAWSGNTAEFVVIYDTPDETSVFPPPYGSTPVTPTGASTATASLTVPSTRPVYDVRLRDSTNPAVGSLAHYTLSVMEAFVPLSYDHISDGSKADTLAKITAASDGQVVQIGPSTGGTFTWTGPGITINKRITVQGAGPDKTTIYDDTDHVNAFWLVPPIAPEMIYWPLPSGVSRIAGITVVALRSDDGAGTKTGTIRVDGSASGQIRIDHCVFTPQDRSSLWFYGAVNGVVDHTTFLLEGLGFGLEQFGESYGDPAWAAPALFGDANHLFVETCTFFSPASGGAYYASDGWMGVRMVFRYNNLLNCVLATHGTDSGGRQRGARSIEYYNNAFDWRLTTPMASNDAMNLRAGGGLIWGNRMTTAGGLTAVVMANFGCYRAFSNFAADNRIYHPFGLCGVQQVTSLTNGGVDGRTVTCVTSSENYLEVGQNMSATIAQATPAFFNGTFKVDTVPDHFTFTYTLPAPQTPTTASWNGVVFASGCPSSIVKMSPWDGNQDVSGYPPMDMAGRGAGVLLSGDDPIPAGPVNQAMEPTYAWDNTINGSPWLINNNLTPALFIENRDYFHSATKPAALASYTPYPYPHPLVGGVTPTITMVVAPNPVAPGAPVTATITRS